MVAAFVLLDDFNPNPHTVTLCKTSMTVAHLHQSLSMQKGIHGSHIQLPASMGRMEVPRCWQWVCERCGIMPTCNRPNHSQLARMPCACIRRRIEPTSAGAYGSAKWEPRSVRLFVRAGQWDSIRRCLSNGTVLAPYQGTGKD